MAGGTLTPGAISGKNVLFTSSTVVFFTSDVGRIIVFGASRALIISFGASAGDTTSPNANVRADILDQFPNLSPIPSGLWLLRLSPQSALDPNKKEPVGTNIILIADKPTFRGQDAGKYIHIYGGVVVIKSVDSVTQVTGEIVTVLQTTASDPAAAPAGSWTLEESSWSSKNGFPRTGEFFQGRLGQAATKAQPTTFWLSQSDGFDRYAVGIKADQALSYTIASRQLNRIQWLAERQDLFVGTSGAELSATSGRTDAPFGGDIIPSVKRNTVQGSTEIQPVTVGNNLLFVDRSQKKIFNIVFDLYQNLFSAQEVTGISDHITGDGLRLGPIGFTKRPDPRLYFVRQDGTLIALTFFEAEKVIGFTRFVTDGTFEAVAVIPGATNESDQVWVIVKRMINGAEKKYIEMFEDNHEDLVDRSWKSLQTDCAFVYRGVETQTITGLDHLNGATVDVIADGGFIGTKVISAGALILDLPATEVEIGLHYDSTIESMRPAVQDRIIEGIPRSWDKIWLRLLESIGGNVNNVDIQYPQSPSGRLDLFTGDRPVTGIGWGTDGRIKVVQSLPYPMTILALFGTLSLADND